MAVKRRESEAIVTKLRQVEELVGQGMARVDAICQFRITEQTFYRWRKQYGGMGTDQLKGLKLVLPGKTGERRLRNQEVFYGKRKQAGAGISA